MARRLLRLTILNTTDGWMDVVVVVDANTMRLFGNSFFGERESSPRFSRTFQEAIRSRRSRSSIGCFFLQTAKEDTLLLSLSIECVVSVPPSMNE